MNAFFAPAVQLMLRLRFASKFALSGLLLLGLLIYLGASDIWANHERVRALQGQREATALMRHLVEWNQVLIDSRQLAITAAVGDTTVRSRFAAQAQVVEHKLAEIEAEAQRMRPWLDLGPQVAAMRQGWQTLRQKVEALPLDESFAQQAFAAHAPEYGRLYGVMRELGDGSGLSLEPELDLFYLGFPLMNHTPSTAGIAVRIAAYTTLNLRRGELRPADRVFYEVTEARLNDTLGQVESMLAQSMAANPAVKNAIGPAFTTLKDQASTYLAYVRQNFTTATALQQNQEQAARAAQATIGAAWHLVEQNRAALATLLAQRQDEARLARNLMAGVVALAILLSTYCYLAMYLAIRQTLMQARAATRAMAGGRLGEVPEPLSRDEFSELMGDLRQADHALASTVGMVRNSAEDVASASAQIAQGNGDLSSRTSQQASALQETAAAMEELAATIGNTAQSAQQANDLVERGGSIVGQNLDMMQALNRQMLAISQSSDRIGEIIGVIESIAFQTNILALNAAVEAARAGEQGKGFAVVASEVRALAQKSAGAAKEIKQLIDTSGQQVADGRSLSLKAEVLLNEMVGNASGVAQLIKDIALASREQTQGVSQVNQAIAQIDTTTQQNAALVEESAAAADGLRVQAHQLVSAVSVFQTT